MRKIIEGKVYDTETAARLCDIYCSANRGDFEWHDTGLYKTRKGAFFLAGEGGAASRWRHPVGNGHAEGEGLVLISQEEARAIFERNGKPADYAEHFGEPEEG